MLTERELLRRCGCNLLRLHLRGGALRNRVRHPVHRIVKLRSISGTFRMRTGDVVILRAKVTEHRLTGLLWRLCIAKRGTCPAFTAVEFGINKAKLGLQVGWTAAVLCSEGV